MRSYLHLALDFHFNPPKIVDKSTIFPARCLPRPSVAAAFMPSDDSLANTNYTLFKDIFVLLDIGDYRLLQTFGLSHARFDVLSHLARQRELSPSELGALMFCDKANVTRLLAGMEKDKLVKRTQHKTDGRRVRIALTPAGEALWAKATSAHDKFSAARLDCFLGEEHQTLNELLVRLKAVLQKQLET